MNKKYSALCWLCLTVLTTAGLKYVPSYLVEQRKLDQQDRVLDLRERAYLKTSAPAPTVSVPVPQNYLPNSQLL